MSCARSLPFTITGHGAIGQSLLLHNLVNQVSWPISSYSRPEINQTWLKGAVWIITVAKATCYPPSPLWRNLLDSQNYQAWIQGYCSTFSARKVVPLFYINKFNLFLGVSRGMLNWWWCVMWHSCLARVTSPGMPVCRMDPWKLHYVCYLCCHMGNCEVSV